MHDHRKLVCSKNKVQQINPATSNHERRGQSIERAIVASPPKRDTRKRAEQDVGSVMEVMRARAWLRSATTGVIERGVFFGPFPSPPPPRVATTTSLSCTRDRKLSISSGTDDIEPQDRDLYRLPSKSTSQPDRLPAATLERGKT